MISKLTKYTLSLYCFIFTVAAQPSFAESYTLPIDLFAGKPALSNVSLSLDGSKLTYLVRKDGKEVVVIKDLDSGAIRGLPIITNYEFEGIRWVNHEVLLVAYSFTDRIRGRDVWTTRLASYDTSKKDLKPRWLKAKAEAGYNPPRQATVVNWLPNDPEHILRQVWNYNKIEIRKLNVYNGREKLVEEGRDGLNSYVFDHNQDLRIMAGYVEKEQVYRYSYKSLADGKWRVLHEEPFKLDSNGFGVYAFTKDPAIAYVMDASDRGTRGLYLMNLETGKKVEEVFSHPHFDIAGAEFTGPSGDSGLATQGKLSAVYYWNDQLERHFVSKYSKKIQEIIDNALPDTHNTIISQARKAKRFVIRSNTPKDDGVYYYLDLTTGSLAPIGERRPGLHPKYMGDVERVDIPVNDGSTIPAYVTYPAGKKRENLPTVILPHGGPHARDYMVYDFLSQFIANRGFLVIQPNFRGSAGYGLDYLSKGIKQWGGLMQQDVENTTDWAIKNGFADPDRMCLAGWSYGGYASLIGAVQTPKRYQCFVSINGVSNIPEMKSSDKYKFAFGRQFIKDVGLDGAEDSEISPYHQSDKIVRPVLLVATTSDARVPSGQSSMIHEKLKDRGLSEFLLMDEGDHSIVDVENRSQLLKTLEAFLAKHIGD